MSTVATAQLPQSVLDDDAWDDLLSFIEERRVIPIVGPELLQVATERGPRLLYDWLAEKLAARLNVDVSQLPQPYTLNDVVCWFLGARGRREEAYVRLRSILKDAPFEPPRAARAPTWWRPRPARAVRRPCSSASAFAPRVLRAGCARLPGSRPAGTRPRPSQHVELARALYAKALIDPSHRAALLQEAATLFESVPPQMQGLRSVRIWRDRVRDALHAPAAGLAPLRAFRGVG